MEEQRLMIQALSNFHVNKHHQPSEVAEYHHPYLIW